MPSRAKTLPKGQPQKAVLRIENLHTWFEIRRMGFFKAGDVRALDGATFELYEGETISIVGESGCGKSTLAKTILGINHISKGSIFFEDKDLSTLDKEGWKRYRSAIGYIQQDPYGALPPFMTVQRILEEPMKINGITDKAEQKKRIRQVLEEVKLAPIEDF